LPYFQQSVVENFVLRVVVIVLAWGDVFYLGIYK